MGLKSRTQAALGLTVFGLTLTPALAWAESGWRLSATVSESLSVTQDNVLSFTRLGVNATTQTERMRFGVNSGVGLSFGSGGVSSATLPNLGLTFGLDTSRRSSITASANLDFQPITFTEDENLGQVDTERTGLRRTVGASLGGNYELTPRSVASLTGSYRDLSYSEDSDDFVASRTTSLTGSLNYEAADDLGIVASLGARWIDSDEGVRSKSFTLDGSVRATYEASSRLSLNAGVGFTRAETEEDDTVILGLITRTTTNSTSFLVNAGLSYGLPDGTLRAGLSQSVSPSATSGELTRFTSGSLGYTHELNRTTNLGLDLQLSNQESLTTDSATTQFSISPFVTWDILDDVQARLGYSLRRRDSQTFHRLNLFISRTFSSAQ